MPKSVLNCTLTVSQGKYAFDPVSKVLSWDVGKMEAQRASPNMRGTVKHIFLYQFMLHIFIKISCPVDPPRHCINS